ncbi:hypothetical protein [Salipaludibacillus aurantiacus]|uniref:YceG-like family protein n=1 Tax=Salipaludibacillus aurantiacus TaxID=1601833 RepID=A0A1H9XAL6_9BACI|nr:hypothetical protein [Salipaludibacillus aurantiacus]SES43172.1 hypothetical protein SAMN05518684_1328 [Salipaludibacillus aurantiacus]
MTKSNLRSAAAGILLATAVLAPFSLFTDQGSEAQSMGGEENDPVELTDEELEVYINERGLISMSEEEYEAMQEKLDRLGEAEDEVAALRKEAEEAEETDSDNNDANDKAEAEDEGEDQSSGDETIHQLYLVIGAGMSSGEIAILLEESKLIDDGADFRQYIEDNDLVMSIKAGQYMLDSSMSIAEIADKIT